MITLMEYETLTLVQNGADLLRTLEEKVTYKHKIRARVESLARSGHLHIARTSQMITDCALSITLKGSVAIEEVDQFIEQVKGTKI